MNIAIIPARSGSIRLKNKNILNFHGLPLLIHTVNAAIESKLFDIIHVSTDSEEICNIARNYGADVPVLRSVENSRSDSSSMAVIIEVVEYYEKQGMNFEYIALLQPTSPLRKSINIIEAFEKFRPGVFSVVSVTKKQSGIAELDHHLKIKSGLMPEKFIHIFGDYLLNGAIYILKRQNLHYKEFYTRESVLYVMDPKDSIDIDTYQDLTLAAKFYVE